MENIKQICDEILEEIKKNNVETKRGLNQIKLRILNRHKPNGKASHIPKNADIYFEASKEERQKLKEILSLKPVRTISGVAPIALMSEPYPCPHTMKGIGPCTYCPGGPGSAFGNVPQSYTGKEPSTRRAIRNNYDPYLIVFNRLEHYIAMGRVPDKAEIIIQGGTFTFFPRAYQEYFVKYALKAMNDFSKLFFEKNGNLDFAKLKKFFELPMAMSDDGNRIRRVQKKILHIKNMDLNDLEVRKNVDFIIFENNINNASDELKNSKQNEITVSEQKQELESIGNGIKNANLLAIKNIQNKIKTEDNQNLSLRQIQKENETSLIRCVGLTIETKSDFGKLYHGNLMLELGCTRVELGIQSIYDNVLEATNRGNSAADNIESIRTLKDLGFKINAHYMPGLPLTTKEMDLTGIKSLFESPDYKPDMLKIYPCMVMKGTKLYDDWKRGKFKPLTTLEAAEMIAEAKRFVPEYVRITRIQRDIPTYVTAGGVDRTNLRQYVEKLCTEKGIKCRCIRCREAGLNSIQNKNINLGNLKLKVLEYEASKGKEFFISAEDIENDVIFGYCRLRFPSQFLREEITKDSALIRELHVYSAAVQIGKKSDDSFQHKGVGKQLMAKAEEIAKEHKKSKIVVISGIGARQYFSRLMYNYDGHYMSKMLN